jgi:hypothetical protein
VCTVPTKLVKNIQEKQKIYRRSKKYTGEAKNIQEKQKIYREAKNGNCFTF